MHRDRDELLRPSQPNGATIVWLHGGALMLGSPADFLWLGEASGFDDVDVAAGCFDEACNVSGVFGDNDVVIAGEADEGSVDGVALARLSE